MYTITRVSSCSPDGDGELHNHSTTTFEDLYKYRPAIFKRLLYKTGNNNELTEDLCQEVLFKAWRYLPKMQHGRALWGFLSLITDQVYMDWSRYRKDKLHTLSYDTHDFEGQDSLPSSRFDPDRYVADLDIMRRALKETPEHDRRVLIDFYIHNKRPKSRHDVYNARRYLKDRYQTLKKRVEREEEAEAAS